VNDLGDRGENIPSDRGDFPEVEALDEYDVRDGTL